MCDVDKSEMRLLEPMHHVILGTQAYLMSHRADISPVSFLRMVTPTWPVRVIKGRPVHRTGVVHLALGYSRLLSVFVQQEYSFRLQLLSSVLALFHIFTSSHHAQAYQQPC